MVAAFRRSREGAWIEISIIIKGLMLRQVAPARERGLKSVILDARAQKAYSRSREGAWIEISVLYLYV